MTFKSIGKKIQLAREDKGITQQELAKILGISQAALSHYESGKRRLYLHQIEKIASILEKPLAYFLDENFEEEIDTIIENELFHDLLKKIYRLRKEEIEEVNKFVDFLLWRRINDY